MFWKAVGRMIVVPFGFLLATATALFVLFTLGLERLTQSAYADAAYMERFDQLLAFLNEGTALVAAFTIIPAIGFAIVGEVARIRSLLYYVIGGGVSLAVTPLLAHGSAGGPAVFWQVFAAAGFAGGFVYWLVAGRSA